MHGTTSTSAKQNADLIPKGTIAKVRLTIRPGGSTTRPRAGPAATPSAARRELSLSMPYTVLEGPYARRKIWSMMRLCGPGPDWGNMGRGFVQGMSDDRGLSDKDNTPDAQNARRIFGVG